MMTGRLAVLGGLVAIENQVEIKAEAETEKRGKS